MTPVGCMHTKLHERLPRALILSLMGVLDRAYPLGEDLTIIVDGLYSHHVEKKNVITP